MSRQRQRMLLDLVSCARAIGARLWAVVPSLAVEGNNDEAGYAFFFEQFLTELEDTAKVLDERVAEESRDLLVLATCRIFANLARLQPSLDLEAVTAPDDLSCRTAAMQKAAEANNDEAGYAFFFEQFLTKLEETTKSFDECVVEESRDLLELATCRIFANLARLQPSLDLEAVTVPVNSSCPTAVSDRIRKAAEAYAKIFDQVEVGGDEDDGKEDASEEEESATADDEGTSGGPTA